MSWKKNKKTKSPLKLVDVSDIKHIRDSEFFIWVEVIGALIGVGQQLWYFLVFSGNKFVSMKLFSESENKVRDAVIVVLNVIIGYVFPFLAFFTPWEKIVPYWAEITIYIVCGLVIINNLVLWRIIKKALDLTSRIDEDKLYGRKK